MTGSNGRSTPVIDKRDFDAYRRSSTSHELDAQEDDALLHSRSDSRLSTGNRFSDNNDGLLTDVVDELVERDRRKMAREVVRIFSFAWGVVTCLGAGSITAFSLYGPLFLTRMHYTQLRVNEVSIAAGISMYLPVSLAGYLCDRYSPSPLTLFAGITFGFGYLLAAFAYKSGPPPDAGGDGWPFWVMVVAFSAIGVATCSMYLAAVTTCAKNFGRGKHKGIILAVPIAAFGLSGMWQSQVGTYLLCERLEDGSCGEVDVYKYFVFLAILLVAIGVIGTFALRIVGDDEGEYIDEAVEELERSGLLTESEFFQPRSEVAAAYGTFARNDNDDDGSNDLSITLSEEQREAARREKEKEEEERRKKNWLLNYETKTFLADHTMWWLAVGFFLVTGPGEAYLNNLGTIVQTLNSDSTALVDSHPAGLPSTHVTIIALTSTIARLLTGSLSDLFAPRAADYHFLTDNEAPTPVATPDQRRVTLSRLAFLIPSALLLSLGFLLLASPFPTRHPELSHLTTALVGLGYGSAFSLVPIIISVVWGVENFGTNWGIVAMFPAVGAAMWGLIYSRGYQDATNSTPGNGFGDDGQCHGWRCFGFWAIGCTASVWVAVGAWSVAWRSWRKRGVVV